MVIFGIAFLPLFRKLNPNDISDIIKNHTTTFVHFFRMRQNNLLNKIDNQKT